MTRELTPSVLCVSCLAFIACPCCVLILLSLSVEAQVSFFQPPRYSGSGPVFVADFNSDGKPDILTWDGTLNLGNGDGTFKLGTPVSGGVLTVADFNGDGKPDILENGTTTLSVLVVLLGNGDGTFQAPISTPDGGSLTLVAAADLNGDGKADVVATSGSSLLVYIGKGDGTFAPGVSYSLGMNVELPQVLSLGDFNGDGKTDLAVSTGYMGQGIGQEIVFLGNGDGTFQTTPKTSTGIQYPGYAAVGDFNGDGKVDIALSPPVGHYVCSPYCNVYLLLGNGDGTFQAPVAVLSGIAAIAAADVNGDGKLDLVDGSALAQIYLGNGDGTFSNANNYVASLGDNEDYEASVYAIAIADFNLDGKPDIALSSNDNLYPPGINVVLLGKGDGSFQGIPVVLASCLPLVVGDFDKNGTVDVAGVSGNSLCILSNDGGGKLSLTHTYTLQQPGSAMVTADFNGDGNLDLMVVGTDSTTGSWEYSILLGNGDGSFQSPIYYPQNVTTGVSGYSAYSVVVADFNNDHKADVAVVPVGSSVDGNLAVLLGNGDGTFASSVYYYDAGDSPLLLADFNGDGKLDIATGGNAPVPPNTPETAILYGNGDGTFQPMVVPASLIGFAPAFTADLNNDGKADLVSYNQVALGNGDGTFTVLPRLSASVSFQANMVADFNGDGKPDLVVNAGQVLLGNGDGTFSSSVSIIPTTGGSLRTPILVADMNGDGRTDIVFPFGAAGVLLNTTPPGFKVVASVPSPAPVIAGSSATSTVTVTPTFGFNSAVTLSCTGLPSGTSCAFNPVSIANSSGTSTLTIATNTSTAAGTYTVQVKGSSGSIVNNTPVSLVVQAAPDFTIGAASGSPTSETISAGQTATFTLALAPTGSFTGTVNLSCAITPSVTPAPTCTLSSSSVQISGSGTQSLTVKMGTTAPVTSSSMPTIEFPPGAMAVAWTLVVLGPGLLLARTRKRLPVLAAPVLVLAVASWVSCGGNGSQSTHTRPETPAGPYNVAVTATSGSLSHNMSLTVAVQ